MFYNIGLSPHGEHNLATPSQESIHCFFTPSKFKISMHRATAARVGFYEYICGLWFR